MSLELWGPLLIKVGAQAILQRAQMPSAHKQRHFSGRHFMHNQYQTPGRQRLEDPNDHSRVGGLTKRWRKARCIEPDLS